MRFTPQAFLAQIRELSGTLTLACAVLGEKTCAAFKHLDGAILAGGRTDAQREAAAAAAAAEDTAAAATAAAAASPAPAAAAAGSGQPATAAASADGSAAGPSNAAAAAAASQPPADTAAAAAAGPSRASTDAATAAQAAAAAASPLRALCFEHCFIARGALQALRDLLQKGGLAGVKHLHMVENDLPDVEEVRRVCVCVSVCERDERQV